MSLCNHNSERDLLKSKEEDLQSLWVRTVMMYGSETWAMTVEDTQKLKRTEASMMRWMCGVSLKKHLSNEALRGRLGLTVYLTL